MNYTKPSKINLLLIFITTLIISLNPLTALAQEIKPIPITTEFLQNTNDIFDNPIPINPHTTTIITLFASPLCKACTHIEQELDRIYRNYKNSKKQNPPLIITIVKPGFSINKIIQKYKKLEIDYPWIIDNQAIFDDYEIDKIPTLLIFDTKGNILKKFNPSKLKSLDLQITINKYNKEQ